MTNPALYGEAHIARQNDHIESSYERLQRETDPYTKERILAKIALDAARRNQIADFLVETGQLKPWLFPVLQKGETAYESTEVAQTDVDPSLEYSHAA